MAKATPKKKNASSTVFIWSHIASLFESLCQALSDRGLKVVISDKLEDILSQAKAEGAACFVLMRQSPRVIHDIRDAGFQHPIVVVLSPSFPREEYDDQNVFQFVWDDASLEEYLQGILSTD